jgi:hypothetical protein
LTAPAGALFANSAFATETVPFTAEAFAKAQKTGQPTSSRSTRRGVNWGCASSSLRIGFCLAQTGQRRRNGSPI